MWRYFQFVVVLLILPSLLVAQPTDLEEQVRRIAAELRCPVCQNLSTADSPSELAQQMRGVIREQLKEGKSPQQIKAYFVSKYGEWILLAPTPKGFSLLLWILPFVAVISGIVLVIFVARHWVRKKNSRQPPTVDPVLIERVQREVAEERPVEVDPEAETPRSLLLQEQARLYADLKELEFDYQAGRLSETDYQDLRRDLQNQAATVLKELDNFAPTRPGAQESPPKTKRAVHQKETIERQKAFRRSWRGWQVAAGGAFLLLFGITLGVLLTKSLRPRLSEQESITGDFLTGTGPGGIGGSSGKNISSLLAQGRAAFERKEWAQAIEAFKGALTLDSNHPEAHTYMGLILTQAGHTDSALLAFNRALLNDPNFPLALWGKGMLLYRAKEDFSGARQTLGRLLSIMPPGVEKNEIQKTITELSSRQKEGSKKAKVRAGPAQKQIQGIVSVDSKLEIKVDAKAVLFIIARSANSTRRPPLAVRRVEAPVFPLSYSLGPENVMVPGVPFSGKVVISARLDKDGNPMTREPGNLTGEYKKNPVEIGSKEVDILIDHIM